jgi:hypothetical protein
LENVMEESDEDGEEGKAWMSGECASWIYMGVIFLC